jgi:hypothetical protein
MDGKDMIEMRMGKFQVIHSYPSRVDEDPLRSRCGALPMRRARQKSETHHLRGMSSQGFISLQLEQWLKENPIPYYCDTSNHKFSKASLTIGMDS